MAPFSPSRPEVRPSRPALPDWPDALLSEADVRHLEEGLGTFIRVYARLPPTSFPDLVLYTDTSARPLAALFRPALRALAERAHRPDPEVGFLVTHRNDLIIDALWNGFADWDALPAWYLENRTGQIDRLIERVRRKMPRAATLPGPEAARQIEDSQRFIREREEERRTLPEAIQAWRLHWDQLVARFCGIAERVRHRTVDAKSVSLLVIDEQVYHTHTIKLILLAVQAANERLARARPFLPLELRFFAFGDARVERFHHEHEYPDAPFRDFRSELGDRYLVGCRSRIAGEFQYASSIDQRTREEPDPLWKERSVGVTKSLAHPYAQRSPHADLERMRALRHLLGAIGAYTVDGLLAEAYPQAP